MNSDTFNGKWKVVKGNVKKKWGDLTDDDIKQIDGQKDILVGKVQEKYGKSREEAEKEVDQYFESA